jgi:hypothetical protein
MEARERDQRSRGTRVDNPSRALPHAFSNERMVRVGTRGIMFDGCSRRDTSLQADDHQPNRIPDSETQQAMDLQEQPEPFATAPALSYTDLRPPTNTQMSDSLLRRSLLRRSLLLHRKPMLVWKRRKWCWEGANSLERREDGRAGRELRGSKLRRSGPAQKTMRPRAASRGHQ